MFRLIIAGCQSIQRYSIIKEQCDLFLGNYQDVEIVSGELRGIDYLLEKYAHEKGFRFTRFVANASFGNKAHEIQNMQMVEYADALLAFWDKKNKAIRNMIIMAKKGGIRVTIHLL